MSIQLKSASTYMTASKTNCLVYDASMQVYNMPQFSVNFQQGLEELQGEYDPEKFYKFIDTFGTHFVSEVHMGAKYGYISEINKDGVASLTRQGISVGYAASASAWGFSASTSAAVNYDASAATAFNKERKSFRVFSVGAKIPADGSPYTWASNAFEEPMPISYTVETLDVALARKLSATDSRIANLKTALGSYCRRLEALGKVESCTDIPGLIPDRPLNNSCRLCAFKCGNGYTDDVGVFNSAQSDHWDWFYNYQEGCVDGDYGINGVSGNRGRDNHLCCQPEKPKYTEGSCKLC